MNWLRKHKKTILIVLIGSFLVSTFIAFGLYEHSDSAAARDVAEVNEEKIPYSYYLSIYNRAVNARRDNNETLTPEMLAQLKQEVVQELVRESVFAQEAKRYSIQVGDQELAQVLTNYAAFKKDGKFDPNTYAQALQYSLRTTPEEFEESQRKQISIAKLRGMVTQSIKISNKELELEFAMRQGSLSKDQLKEFSKDRNKFRQYVMQEKGAQILNRWYQQLGTNLKVKVHLDEIERRSPGSVQ